MKAWFVSAICVLLATAAVTLPAARGQVAGSQAAAPQPTAPQPTAPQPTAPQPTAPQPTAPQLAHALRTDLERALLSTQAFDGLDVKAQKSSTGLWVLNVASGGVGWASGTTEAYQHSEATVAVGWYDADNNLVGNLVQQQNFRRVIADGDAVYSMRVEAPAAAVRLRFVVRDALNGHMGTIDVTHW